MKKLTVTRELVVAALAALNLNAHEVSEVYLDAHGGIVSMFEVVGDGPRSGKRIVPHTIEIAD